MYTIQCQTVLILLAIANKVYYKYEFLIVIEIKYIDFLNIYLRGGTMHVHLSTGNQVTLCTFRYTRMSFPCV